MILNEFLSWANQFEGDNAQTKVEVKACKPTDNPAASLTVLSREFAGQITVWSSREFNIEMLGVETVDGTFFEYGENLVGDDFDLKFKKFIEMMKLRKRAADQNGPA